MTRPYSIAFKQKMINRLTGRDAVSANQLAKDTSIRQQNLSRWLREARSLPLVATDKPNVREWTVEEKARVLADASYLTGEELTAHLEREDVKLAEFEQWRLALEEGGRASTAITRRIRKLERELARKEVYAFSVFERAFKDFGLPKAIRTEREACPRGTMVCPSHVATPFMGSPSSRCGGCV